MQFKYLNGLNGLRFFAAFFVIISHAAISIEKLGIAHINYFVFLNRGEDAVNFFFTLSGFLITYLLQIEIKKTGTVSIKEFYLRRIFRIWPLYFIIIVIGFLLLGVIYPWMYGKPYFTFTIPEGLLMFVFFVPNYAAKNFAVGLLNPLWSIGVEEQFYLFWAPLVKCFKNRMKVMIVAFVLISTIFYVLLYTNILVFAQNWQRFLLTQKFFAMAIGAMFAYILYSDFKWYNKSFLASYPFQFIIIFLVIYHYLIGFPFSENLFGKIFFSVIYGFLILNVSTIDKKLINLETKILKYLGVISYGLYMFHMVIDYVLRLLYPYLIRSNISNYILIPLYFVLLLFGTIVLAGLSYKYIESYFLNIKNKFNHQA